MRLEKLKIYLAGKMSGLSFEESDEWRRDFKGVFKREMNYDTMHYTIINPNDYYNFKNPSHQNEREVMQYDLNHVRSSDIVVVNLEDINTSIGTAIELYVAAQNNIPVLAWGSDEEWRITHPWLKECISRVESDVCSLCNYIFEYYSVDC